MTQERIQIETDILNYIKEKRNTVTFAELSRNIENFKGDYNYSVPGNLIIWTNISLTAIEAVVQLVKSGKILPEPAPVMYYLIDGATLNLPIAKSIKSYKNPRWMPTMFSFVE